MLLMKVSAIIIEIVALVVPYDAITAILLHFVPGNLANWRYSALIKAVHDYSTLVKFTVLSIKLLFFGASLLICLITSVQENWLKTC